MPQYGLSTEGFLVKTLDILRDEIGAALQQAFGPSIRLDDQSILGQLVGIIAERLALLWELAEVVNSAQDPDSASGAALEQICLLTGTLRPPATYSTVTLTLTGDPTTVVSASQKVRTASTQVEFETRTSVTITALTPWVLGTAYVVGDRVTSNSACFECITAGTSGPGFGPSGDPDYEGDADGDGDVEAQTADDIEDGTVHWAYLGEGTGAIDVVAAAVTSGPVTAVARDITEIVNTVSGWDNVINVADASTGRAIATDAELRLLREQELASGGSATPNALRAELRKLTEVVSATIFVNNTDSTNSDGLPPHTIEVLVRGPEIQSDEFDQLIFDTLLDGVAAGIRTYANPSGNAVVGTATDDEGTEHAIEFSRPVEVPIYAVLTVIKDPDTYPDDGDDQIAEAIVEWGDLQNTGKNVVAARIAAAAFEVAGVLDVVTCFIGTAPAPGTSTTIDIDLRELATYDTTRITVNSSDGVP